MNPMYPVRSTMRSIPGLRRPVFLVLVASALAALSLLFWSRQYVEITTSRGGGQRLHVSGLRGKECLTREFPSLVLLYNTWRTSSFHYSIDFIEFFLRTLIVDVLHSTRRTNCHVNNHLDWMGRPTKLIGQSTRDVMSTMATPAAAICTVTSCLVWAPRACRRVGRSTIRNC